MTNKSYLGFEGATLHMHRSAGLRPAAASPIPSRVKLLGRPENFGKAAGHRPALRSQRGELLALHLPKILGEELRDFLELGHVRRGDLHQRLVRFEAVARDLFA